MVQNFRYVVMYGVQLMGLNFLSETPGDELKQNQLYNGWTLYPDSKICVFPLNAPGMFYDSTIADYGVYEGMETFYDATGGKIIVDSVFNIRTKPYLIKSIQQDPIDGHTLLVNCQVTSIR